jgi:hypothetical protein
LAGMNEWCEHVWSRRPPSQSASAMETDSVVATVMG